MIGIPQPTSDILKPKCKTACRQHVDRVHESEINGNDLAMKVQRGASTASLRILKVMLV